MRKKEIVIEQGMGVKFYDIQEKSFVEKVVLASRQVVNAGSHRDMGAGALKT